MEADRRKYDLYATSRPPPNPSSSFYPRISQAAGPDRSPPPVPAPAPAPVAGSGIGVKVVLKPQYRISPPVQLSPLVGEVTRTPVQFDFDFERKVIADAERGVRTQVSQSQLANGGESASSSGMDDPVLGKYFSLGLNREAVTLGIAAYGDVHNKVVEFCSAYSLLREMGFPSEAVARALVLYDNDKEKALAQFV